MGSISNVSDDSHSSDVKLLMIGVLLFSTRGPLLSIIKARASTSLHKVQRIKKLPIQSRRQSSRLKEPSVYQGVPKLEIKHKSRCFQKSKLANWGAKHDD